MRFWERSRAMRAVNSLFSCGQNGEMGDLDTFRPWPLSPLSEQFDVIYWKNRGVGRKPRVLFRIGKFSLNVFDLACLELHINVIIRSARAPNMPV